MAAPHHKMPWDEDEKVFVPKADKVVPTPASQELAGLPPSVPLRWITVPADKRPYSDYRDEYLRSSYSLDALTLSARWAGIADPQEIYAFFELPGLEEDRYGAQNAGLDPDSPEFRLRQNRVMRMRFWDLMENAMGTLRKGGTPKRSEESGMIELEPLTGRERDALVKQVAQFFTAHRLLNGESTKIIEEMGKTGEITINQLLVQGMAALPPEVQNILAISMGAMLGGTAPNPSQSGGETYEQPLKLG